MTSGRMGSDESLLSSGSGRLLGAESAVLVTSDRAESDGSPVSSGRPSGAASAVLMLFWRSKSLGLIACGRAGGSV